MIKFQNTFKLVFLSIFFLISFSSFFIYRSYFFDIFKSYTLLIFFFHLLLFLFLRNKKLILINLIISFLYISNFYSIYSFNFKKNFTDKVSVGYLKSNNFKSNLNNYNTDLLILNLNKRLNLDFQNKYKFVKIINDKNRYFYFLSNKETSFQKLEYGSNLPAVHSILYDKLRVDLFFMDREFVKTTWIDFILFYRRYSTQLRYDDSKKIIFLESDLNKYSKVHNLLLDSTKLKNYFKNFFNKNSFLIDERVSVISYNKDVLDRSEISLELGF